MDVVVGRTAVSGKLLNRGCDEADDTGVFMRCLTDTYIDRCMLTIQIRIVLMPYINITSAICSICIYYLLATDFTEL